MTELETAKTEAAKKVTEIQDNKGEINKQIEALQTKLEEQKNALMANQKVVEDAKKQQTESNDKANTHLNNNNYNAQDFDAQKNAIQSDINAIKAETEAQTKINSDLNPAAIDLTDIEAQIQQMTQTLNDLNTQETQALEEQAQVEADIKAIQVQQVELGTQLKQEEIKKAEEEKKAKKEQETKDIDSLKAGLASAKQAFEASSKSHEAAKKTASEAINTNQANITTLESKIKENQIPEILKQPKGQATNTNITPTSFTDSKAGQQEVAKLKINKDTADGKLQETTSKLNETDNAIAELKQQIEEQKAQLEAKKQEIQTQITTDTKTLEGATGVKTEAAEAANNKEDIAFDAAKGDFDTIKSEINKDIQALNQGTNDLNESTTNLGEINKIEIDTKEIDKLQAQMKDLLIQRATALQAVNTAQSKVDEVSQELANAEAGLESIKNQEKNELDTAKKGFESEMDTKISAIEKQVTVLEELKKQIEEQKTAVTNTNIGGTALQNNTDNLDSKKTSSTKNLDTQLQQVQAEIDRLNEAKKDIESKKDGVEGLSKEELESRKTEANAIDTADKTPELKTAFTKEKDSFNKESEDIKNTNTVEVDTLTKLKTDLNDGVTNFDNTKKTAIEQNQAQATKIEEAKSSITKFREEIASQSQQVQLTKKGYIEALKKVEEQKQPKTIEKGEGEDNKTHLANIESKINETEDKLPEARALSAEKTKTAVKQKDDLDKQTAAMEAKIAELEKLIESQGRDVAKKKDEISKVNIDDDKKKTDIDVTKDFASNQSGLMDSQKHVEKRTKDLNIGEVDLNGIETLKNEIETLKKEVEKLNEDYKQTSEEAAEAVNEVKQLEADMKGLNDKKTTVESEIKKEEALKNFELPEEADLDNDINAVKSKPSIISKDITFKVTAGKNPEQEIKISEKSFRAAHTRWQGNVDESKRSNFVDNPQGNKSGFTLQAADVGRADFNQLNKGADGKIQTNIYNNLLIAQEKLNKTQSIEEAQKIVTECRDVIIGDNSKTVSDVGIKNQEEFKASIMKATKELETQFKQKAEARQRLEAKLQEYNGMQKKFNDQTGLTPEQETKRTNAINKINERISTINNTLLQNTQGATNTQQQNSQRSPNNAQLQTRNSTSQTNQLSRNNSGSRSQANIIPEVAKSFTGQVHPASQVQMKSSASVPNRNQNQAISASL